MTRESATDEGGDVSAVIDVRVAQDERVSGDRPVGELAVSSVRVSSAALIQTAFEQDVPAAYVDSMQGTRHAVRGAVKLEVHGIEA